MKILHVCALGLTVKVLLLPQADYLLSRDVEVEFACSADQATEELQAKGYVIHPIQIDRKITPGGNLRSIYHLTKLMQQQYDLVHVHTPIAAVLGRVAAKLAGVKRIVYTSHGLPFHDQSSPREYFLYSTVEKVCGRLADLIISQNYEDIATAKRLGIAPAHKLGYLGNGVDVNRFNRQRLDVDQQNQLRQSLGIPDSAELIIGTVGRLTRKKGMGYLIEAAAQLMPQFPNLQILIVGGELKTDPEPFQNELIARIKELGMENKVTFTGYRQDIPEIMGLMDIFTLPTFTHEGLPRSIVEAMAMSLPVVATDIRGCREVILPKQTGEIVPPCTIDELASALAKLLAEPQLRQSYGEAGRTRIVAEYDENIVFQRLAKFYQDLGIVFPS